MNIEIKKFNNKQLYNIYGSNIKQLNVVQSNSITQEQFIQQYESVKPYISQLTNQNSYQQIFDIVTSQTLGTVEYDTSSISHRKQLNDIYYSNHKIEKLNQHIKYMKSINQNIKSAYSMNSGSNNQLSVQIKNYIIDTYNTLTSHFYNINYVLFYIQNQIVLDNLNGHYDTQEIQSTYFRVKHSEDQGNNPGITIYTYPQNRLKIKYNTNQQYINATNHIISHVWSPKNDNYINMFSMFNNTLTVFNKIYVSTKIQSHSGDIDSIIYWMKIELVSSYNYNTLIGTHKFLHEGQGDIIQWEFSNVSIGLYYLQISIPKGSFNSYQIILKDLSIRYQTQEICTQDNYDGYSNNYIEITNIAYNISGSLQNLLP